MESFHVEEIQNKEVTQIPPVNFVSFQQTPAVNKRGAEERLHEGAACHQGAPKKNEITFIL